MTPEQVPIYTPNPATLWSGSDLTLVGNDADFDPATGWTYTSEYVGTQAKVQELLALVNAFRVRITTRIEGDRIHLRLVSPDPSFGIEGLPGAETEVPVDVWEFSTEFAEVEIWQAPTIVYQTNTEYIANAATRQAEKARMLSKYKHFVRSRLANLYNGYMKISDELAGNAPPRPGGGPTPHDLTGLYLPNGAPNPDALLDFRAGGEGDNSHSAVRVNALHWIYNLHIMSGSEDLSYASRLPILSRRRTCSTIYAQQIVVGGAQQIYSKVALQRVFGIPADVYARIPEDPSIAFTAIRPPPDTQWGWLIRRQDSVQVARTGKVEETLDWRAAFWSLRLYEYIAT